MPIYEYRCEACGHQFEKIQKMSDRPVRHCPVCNGTVEKLLSVSSFALKGGGWYAQGYSNGGGGSKKSESAPAAKSEPSTPKSGGSD